jgi:cytochrome P450
VGDKPEPGVDIFLTDRFNDPEFRFNPHPFYRELREEHPIRMYEGLGEYLLTRWDDCERVLRDPRFSSNNSHRVWPEGMESTSRLAQSAGDPDVKTLLFLDPPDHTRIRGLVSKAFTPRTVERLRPHITDICNQVLDEAADRGSLEIVGDLGYQVPVTVLCELLGIPLADRHMFGPLSSDASRLLDGDSLSDEQFNAGLVAVMELLSYLNDLFDERRANPGDDLISALIAVEEEGDRLDDVELRSIVLLLFIAGHETTMNLIGNGMWALLQHPDQLQLLRNDPSLIGSAVEEMLRFDGPVHLTGRVATEDLEVGGQTVRKGEQVITLLAAANRDPARFPDPERFDITREDNRHLTFSHGIHYCLGAALARVEGQVAIGSLVERFPAIEPLETPSYRGHFILRGLSSLEVSLS